MMNLLTTTLINLLALSLSLNEKYYAECDYGAPFTNVKSAYECQLYKNVNTSDYCCRLYYEYKSGYSSYSSSNCGCYGENKEEKLDSGHCIGITLEGYNNIKSVIKELEKEFKESKKELHIDCSFKYLEIINKSLILFLLVLLL